MKLLTYIRNFILLLTLAAICAWSVYYVHTGGEKLGFLTKPIKKFSELPELAYNVVNQTVNSDMFFKTDPNFEVINKLDYDLYAMNAVSRDNKWITQLTNLRNDSILHEWTLTDSLYKNGGRLFAHAEPYMPVLLEDTSVIISACNSKNLYRLSKDSKIMWYNSDYRYHHSVNLDKDGNIWLCSKDDIIVPENNVHYVEEYLTKIDVNTGKTIYHKPLTEIFNDNNLTFLTHGLKNNSNQIYNIDPYHLNDIEPALKDGAYWKADDLFVSIRNRSMIFIYRPSTNKVIRTIQGPFYNQHDVDITSDSTITIFNNNVSGLSKKTGKKKKGKLLNNTINKVSEVLSYNMHDSSYVSLHKEQFIDNNVFTEVQGLQETLSNGDLFVENNRSATVFIFSKDGTKLKKYFNKPKDGYTQYPHWVRLYENLDFLNQ